MKKLKAEYTREFIKTAEEILKYRSCANVLDCKKCPLHLNNNGYEEPCMKLLAKLEALQEWYDNRPAEPILREEPTEEMFITRKKDGKVIGEAPLSDEQRKVLGL